MAGNKINNLIASYKQNSGGKSRKICSISYEISPTPRVSQGKIIKS